MKNESSIPQDVIKLIKRTASDLPPELHGDAMDMLEASWLSGGIKLGKRTDSGIVYGEWKEMESHGVWLCHASVVVAESRGLMPSNIRPSG